MRCALIIPAWVPGDIFPPKTAGSQLNYWQPLGTLYVASSLAQAGHEVRFLDGAFLSHAAILDEVAAFRPHWVGIYATAFGWPKAVRTAADVRERDPAAFVCAGGPYPIAAQGRCLEEGPAFDAAVTGEGERTVVEMLERLARGRDLAGVKGVVYRDGDAIRANAPRPLLASLDELPFPDRGFLGDTSRYTPPPAMYRRSPVAIVQTSRGCSRRCIFCFQLDKERRTGVRYRSVENVLAEVEQCLAQGYREIKFIDDTLAQDRQRALRLAREIKRRRLDFTWFASACVNQVDPELLQAFREAGCWAILFGVESGVQKNLEALRKGISVPQARNAVRWAKQAGLHVQTTFMFGIPGETYDEALRTIDFACELGADVASFHALVPFPGTWLHDHVSELGALSDDLADFTYQGAAFVPRTMTRDQIRELRQRAYRRFYSRPAYLARRLLGLRSGRDLRVALRSARTLFWLWAGKDLLVPRPGGEESGA
ncbi:MAG TPA: radical SAM protein [Anaeromyxobacter sp.]|nr:radical SAM protein [Anaeromyxobacter sp.]